MNKFFAYDPLTMTSLSISHNSYLKQTVICFKRNKQQALKEGEHTTHYREVPFMSETVKIEDNDRAFFGVCVQQSVGTDPANAFEHLKFECVAPCYKGKLSK